MPFVWATHSSGTSIFPLRARTRTVSARRSPSASPRSTPTARKSWAPSPRRRVQRLAGISIKPVGVCAARWTRARRSHCSAPRKRRVERSRSQRWMGRRAGPSSSRRVSRPTALACGHTRTAAAILEGHRAGSTTPIVSCLRRCESGSRLGIHEGQGTHRQSVLRLPRCWRARGQRASISPHASAAEHTASSGTHVDVGARRGRGRRRRRRRGRGRSCRRCLLCDQNAQLPEDGCLPASHRASRIGFAAFIRRTPRQRCTPGPATASSKLDPLEHRRSSWTDRPSGRSSNLCHRPWFGDGVCRRPGCPARAQGHRRWRTSARVRAA